MNRLTLATNVVSVQSLLLFKSIQIIIIEN